MKTVNFLEALEANKTRAVIVDDENRSRYKVNSLRELASTGRLDALYCAEALWQVEPEVIEAECEWGSSANPIGEDRYWPKFNSKDLEIIKQIHSKKLRTKVRIEVLGDE